MGGKGWWIMTTAAVIALLLQLVEQAPKIMLLVDRLLSIAEQTGGMTPAEIAEARATAEALFQQPHWQPRPGTPSDPELVP